MKPAALPLIILLLALLPSCQKERGEPSDKTIYGKVYWPNSTTPVPNALVRFLKYTSSPNWGMGASTQVGSDTTDSAGNFTIPPGSETEYVQAWGIESLYPIASEESYVHRARDRGNKMTLYLIPWAWIRFTAVDDPPLNPEVTHITVSRSLPMYGPEKMLNPSAILKNYGQIETYYDYLMRTNGEWVHYYTEKIRLTGLDTTDYVIHY